MHSVDFENELDLAGISLIQLDKKINIRFNLRSASEGGGEISSIVFIILFDEKIFL